MPGRSVRMEELIPGQLEEVLKEAPVVYVPWGAMEWHGEHLPLGQDALKVERICELAAEKMGGVVHPAIYVGHHTMQNYGMPYTLEYSRELVKQLALELFRELEKTGFKVIVVLCGHYGGKHLEAIREAVEEYRASGGKAKVFAEPEYVFTRDIGYRGDHAAKWETSIFWHLYPHLVHMEALPKDLSVKLKGVGGEDPRIHASRELGGKTVNLIVERLTAKVREMLGE